MAADKFVLDTKGMCILCLSEDWTLDTSRELASATSFKVFLHYLKINIFQLKSFEDSFFSTMDNNCVTVSLCRECGTLANKFSELYTKWENIGFELELLVENTHKQMTVSGSDPVKMDEYSRRMKSSSHWKDVLNDNVLQDLRKEAINKCCSRIKFADLQHFTSTSTDKTNSTSTNNRSSLGSTTASSPSGSQTTQPDVLSSSPTTQFAVTDNQQPTTSTGSTTSEDSSHHENTQLQLDLEKVKAEVAVKVECFSPIHDDELDSENDEESFSNQGQYIDDTTNFNLQSNKQRRSAVVSEVIGTPVPEERLDVVVQNHVSDNDKGEKNILPGPAQKRRKFNQNLQQSAFAFACTMCSRQFSSSNSLSLHVSNHNRQQQNGIDRAPYPSLTCATCSKMCKSKAGFVLHKKTHTKGKTSTRFQHPEDRDGYYKCVFCTSIFNEGRHRRRHLAALHTLKYLEQVLPPGTSEINLDSAIERELDNMIRSPEGDGAKHPTKCRYCQQNFNLKSHLRSHIVIMHHEKLTFT